MQNIVPHLWYDKEAREAAEFYTSIFPESSIGQVSVLHNTPSGDTDMVSFSLNGQEFMAISAGPMFKFNQSMSFIVNFDSSKDSRAKEHIDALWEKLAEQGKVLMEIGKYSFSERYGWVEDKFGLSWQLLVSDPTGEDRPMITPSLIFSGKNNGKADEAANFYIDVFAARDPAHTKRGMVSKDENGTLAYADFMLAGTWMAVMDSSRETATFNESVSFVVQCESQEEIDYYWEKLSAVPESEQCGWLKDKYGLSWQITPRLMEKMLTEGTGEQINRVTQAFLPMKKIDIKQIEKAYKG